MKNKFKILLAVLSCTTCTPLFAAGTPLSEKAVEVDPDTVDYAAEMDDPLEDLNRSVFEFNRTLDKFLLKPITEIYKFVLPDSVQDGVHNVLRNISSPIIFINDVLQLNGDRAMNTMARFLINTTLGIGGLFDPASEVFEIEYHSEDFGQTLGAAGVGADPYIVFPVLGPTNPRDLVGRVVDWFIDPFNYAARRYDENSLVYARTGLDAINTRRTHASILENRIYTSPDPYVAMRSLHTQNRNFNVKNGLVEMEESPVPEEFEGKIHDEKK